jgi:hypothetical protein
MTLELKGFVRYFPLVLLPLFVFGGLFGTINAFKDGQIYSEVFMILWISILFYNIYKFSKMVIKIDLL